MVVLLSGKAVEELIALRDEPREDAHAGVKRLTDRGLRAIMLTGDKARTADAIATLWMAILAATGATVLVTANALRLLAHRCADSEARLSSARRTS